MVSLIYFCSLVILFFHDAGSISCPDGGGIVCYPQDCSNQYQQCIDNIFYEPEDTPQGFLCSENLFVFPSSCTESECSLPSCSISQIFSLEEFNQLFPEANGGATNGVPNQHAVFNYDYLLSAAKAYPEFGCTGNAETRRIELAAFLAQTSQETSGWWAGQPYDWGYYFSTELGCSNGNDCPQYCSDDSTYPCVTDQGGPIQLSWNYNYGQASEALFGDKNILLANPDLLFLEDIAFATALWFWMTPQAPKPSCHDVITGQWFPSEDDVIGGRLPGFGMVTNIINGVYECEIPTPQSAENRVEYLIFF